MAQSMPDLPNSCSALLAAFTARSRDHAFICMDPDGAVTGWNDAAAKMFGYDAAEAVGRPLSVLFVEEDRAKGLDRYELQVAAGDMRSEDDRWHLRKDGTRVWVTGTVEALRHDDGRLAGFVKVCRDRTDLRTQFERMEQAAAHSNTFFRTLGHELRNALAPLKSAALIIQRSSQDAGVGRALQIVGNQAAVLARMADDLMNVERLAQGAVELQLERADLRRILEDLALSFEPDALDKGLRIRVILPGSPLLVAIDRPRFQQVVVNLLANAVKYTPAGGSVFVKCTQEGSDVVLRVEDTGVGIAPDVLPRVFELFTRATIAVRMEPGGLGIGLAIVKQIVELHGGTVQARSNGDGHGSEFTVRLPAAGLARADRPLSKA